MYNLKINVTDLLSSKKNRMKYGSCVFFGFNSSLFQLWTINYDTTSPGVC